MSGPIDSESWKCVTCGGQMIGDRPPDDVCPQCVVTAITTHTSADAGT